MTEQSTEWSPKISFPWVWTYACNFRLVAIMFCQTLLSHWCCNNKKTCRAGKRSIIFWKHTGLCQKGKAEWPSNGINGERRTVWCLSGLSNLATSGLQWLATSSAEDIYLYCHCATVLSYCASCFWITDTTAKGVVGLCFCGLFCTVDLAIVERPMGEKPVVVVVVLHHPIAKLAYVMDSTCSFVHTTTEWSNKWLR